MTRNEWLGAAIWLAGFTAGLWAPDKPLPVIGAAGLVLGVIGLVLFLWPRS